ncbi:MAG: pyruvate dehydrogenase (acetyl-transferring) E1 component subunit alpha [Alphaproteobacteria bacterium]|nr:pyruvate dehydrogenase (acetyl-transferring) E1 component subunit alpha [Alphaproteobacteria bacterium]
MRIVARFEIPFTAYLAPDGELAPGAGDFATDRTALVAMYRAMALTRGFDEKAVALQRTGRLGTFASSLGQEAVGVGVAAAMEGSDVLLPSFREHGAQIWRGTSLVELLLYWGGDERGSDFAACREDFPICVPVGSHAPHAVGVALAFALRAQPRVAVAMFGDGATSKGDVAEALNVAGAWRVPAVFIVCNNRWAISVPRAAQTAAETLAQKAIAAGIPGVQVDGNDVIAVRDATARALARARSGEGPMLIEALTYRLADHTTADDARRYRPEAEVSRFWAEEPIARLRNHLQRRHGWVRDEEHALVQDVAARVEAAAAAFLATPPQAPGTIFDFTYAQLPADLAAQRAALLGGGTAESGHG